MTEIHHFQPPLRHPITLDSGAMVEGPPEATAPIVTVPPRLPRPQLRQGGFLIPEQYGFWKYQWHYRDGSSWGPLLVPPNVLVRIPPAFYGLDLRPADDVFVEQYLRKPQGRATPKWKPAAPPAG